MESEVKIVDLIVDLKTKNNVIDGMEKDKYSIEIPTLEEEDFDYIKL